MSTTRRDFGLQAISIAASPSGLLVPVGLAGIGATTLVLPGRAHALAPVPLVLLGAFIATALQQIYGFLKSEVSSVAQADARRVPKPDDFDGMFADEAEVIVSKAWRFDNGAIVGVNGASFGGDPFASRRAALNVSELDAMRHPETKNGWGALIPTSTRKPPDGERRKLASIYKEMHAERQRSRTAAIADPLYVRRFEKMSDLSRVAGVFGRSDDGALRVTWVNASEIA